MYKTLTKNGQLFAFGLGLLLTLAFLGSVFSGLDTFNGLSKEAQYETGIFDLGIYAVVFLTVLCFLIMFAFGIFQVLTNLKGSMKGLIGFVVLLAIFGVAYSTATLESGPFWDPILANFNVTDGASRFITGAIWTCLFMVGVAVVTFVLSEIRNFFK